MWRRFIDDVVCFVGNLRTDKRWSEFYWNCYKNKDIKAVKEVSTIDVKSCDLQKTQQCKFGVMCYNCRDYVWWVNSPNFNKAKTNLFRNEFCTRDVSFISPTLKPFQRIQIHNFIETSSNYSCQCFLNRNIACFANCLAKVNEKLVKQSNIPLEC